MNISVKLDGNPYAGLISRNQRKIGNKDNQQSAADDLKKSNISSNDQLNSNGKSSYDSLIESIDGQLETKKQQLNEVMTDSEIPDNIKKMKKEQIEREMEDLEAQKLEARIQKQKEEIQTETDEQSKKSNESSDDKSSKFIKLMTFVSNKMDSVQNAKQLKVELNRKESFIEQTAETDGFISKHKFDELAQINEGITKSENNINADIGSINKKVKKYIEDEVEEKTETENKAEEESKNTNDLTNKETNHESINEDSENGKINMLTPEQKEIIGEYKNNSFKSYIKEKYINS